MGRLDGLTILRYGHVYDSGGGMEQYLEDLNRVLSERSRLMTIQVQLTSRRERVGEETVVVGQGRILRSSLFVEQASHERAIAGRVESTALTPRLKKRLVEPLLFVPGIYQVATRPLLRRRRIPTRPGEPDGVGQTVLELHRRSPVDLICLHSAGDADAAEVLTVAGHQRIPVVYLHHFANDRLGGVSIRTQLEKVARVGGVTAVGVPRFLRAHFQTVADGIDIHFFQRKNAQPVERPVATPLVFLPARITPTKGQADVVRAAGELRRRGVRFQVALAGRLDNSEFASELKHLIDVENVADCVFLVGQLGLTELRDWYGAADLVAFPTQHHEGLPRILLECQAMQVPPVVFDIGGTSEAVIDNKTGFLVPRNDFAMFVTRLQQLIENPELRVRIGRAGRARVESHFSLAALAARHEDLYCAVLGGTVPSPCC
jgi:glycosyltransferase involved in cell wall biosynthesis